MITTPRYTEHLASISDRSAALRAAAAAAPDLAVTVPGCPAWTLRDLLVHVGHVQRFWALIVAAGPAEQPVRYDNTAAVSGDVLLWSAAATEELLAALRAADPERGCWTWWDYSGEPQTVGAVARHQVQEAAVHAVDAQQAAGLPAELPAEVALDGIAEFIALEHDDSWPHAPALITLASTEGRSWQLELGKPGPDAAQAVLTAPAAELLLTLHRRHPVPADAPLLTDLVAWPTLD
ncbi:maleylpyruvate isomerase family mycothiol-dependent enzyme [Kitasatospora sp. NBC_01287]|uniref:maleylpyruvate isomerase N-terminal domain-containing protein n=1 Tax=Kitasatospora sp. NBC_01287 TaxID=2903573 RepID=UPI00224FE94D|nr:maleylpyruvate isomerase family mycothiol-dependent enzyme [Kitasatospora sp. NBC_01287]MCX4750226.1 maleylpyruvate isomerase family mycothiol-dependent enzyme [Kitasatospora sp. NBC_01287]